MIEIWKRLGDGIKIAYENVCWITLMDRLKVQGFSRNMFAFLFNLVSSRDLEAHYGWVDLKGLSQGSALSSSLYLLYMAGLEFKIKQDYKFL
jgi:hypothetical protein